jgi:glycosyltransferase involved in cell wall biosynthesis
VIGVVIPAYNAQRTVGGAVTGALRQLECVLVVDDGSSDATAARAQEAGAAVVSHPVNRGKGAALQTGFGWMLERGAAAVITMDADLQHEPEDLPRFVEAFGARGADLIIGSRQAEFIAMTPGRRFGNRFSCGALKFFSGLEVPDSQSGYRLYSADFLRMLRLRRLAYDAEMEALLEAARHRSRIETMPIMAREVDGTPTSHFRPWLDTCRIIRAVLWYSICTY